MLPYFSAGDFNLYKGDCLDILADIQNVDMVFADPPYFLSNGGLTIQNGTIVSVDKGDWDKAKIPIYQFNHNWLSAVRNTLKPGGTIWISGTMHNIFHIYQALEDLGFKILNVITWRKLNPPPNFSCRTFTHSTEIIIWARKYKNVPHLYNYELMKALNGGKQMKDVWDFPSIARWEKKQGKHPTQKPLSLLSRIVLASTQKGDLILDPFAGSSTTGIAASVLDRRYIGIEKEQEFVDISINRYREFCSNGKMYYIEKIAGLPQDIAYLNP